MKAFRLARRGGASHIGAMRVAAITALLTLGLLACNPTVKLEAPSEPIVINLNVKIEQEVRVKVDRELDDVISQNKSLF